MITRIVKMTFKTDNIEIFKKIFDESRKQIKAFDGCIELELMNDLQDECTYFTLSRWNSLNDLEKYRNSDLFKSTWAKVKPLFAEKAQAWSLTEYR
jgi:quinol monooxygenase YgiN